MSVCRAIAHCGNGPAQEIDPREIDSLLAQKDNLLWLDIQDPGQAEIDLLRAEFRFHELALEDALSRGQRSKVDDYEGCYFIVLYTLSIGTDPCIDTHELHAFWGQNYLVTLHDGPVAEITTAINRWATSTERRKHGVAYQAYTLLDAVVDGYFPAVDAISERIEDLEARIFDTTSDLIRDVFDLRRNLTEVRRRIAPTRDVLNELIRRDVPVFPQQLVPYLSDVYDHAIRALDGLDVNRELLTSAMESHLSAISNQLNMTVRTMTALTIGIMVPTLVAGIYGMNYRLWPDNDWQFGFAMAVGLMAVLLVGTLAVFRRIGWL
jgi:magnesium transporter